MTTPDEAIVDTAFDDLSSVTFQYRLAWRMLKWPTHNNCGCAETHRQACLDLYKTVKRCGASTYQLTRYPAVKLTRNEILLYNFPVKTRGYLMPTLKAFWSVVDHAISFANDDERLQYEL